jgi:hypothetical protein
MSDMFFVAVVDFDVTALSYAASSALSLASLSGMGVPKKLKSVESSPMPRSALFILLGKFTCLPLAFRDKHMRHVRNTRRCNEHYVSNG